ncbi:hypothetical protein EFP84_20115 [Leptospira kmetyi]|uniref:Uncharacterized protein n=1 Tax=Leptospira kmetyi TaxID=408139 RepID=A0AAD0UV11_9LEPT|nr:hypothetical protein EFP84_20115 [Leptospira kmetyi]
MNKASKGHRTYNSPTQNTGSSNLKKQRKTQILFFLVRERVSIVRIKENKRYAPELREFLNSYPTKRTT